MDWTFVGSLVGGVGLFLLGMRLMTDGLRLAAGSALRSVLAAWTHTPMRGLLSGVLITALVQSSSAVTVAVIGFVNAGLVSLSRTIWVIYGSNVGTTMTGWLVSLVGFKADVVALALPMIGLGMALNITAGRAQRRASIGEALAGFGLFFLGVGILKAGFDHVGHLPMWLTDLSGLAEISVMALVGFVLTFLMQSSSAALALVLAAAAGGMVGLTGAAAAVIGSNVGTTTTAMLSVIGATSAAKRIAAAHVLFNLLTGVVAFLLLPVLLPLLVKGRIWLGLGPEPAALLALFHTMFNMLGVVVMWPLTPRLTSWLAARFTSEEEEMSRPRHLDDNVAGTPELAVEAIELELARIGDLACGAAIAGLDDARPDTSRLAARHEAVVALEDALGAFVGSMQRYNLRAEVSSSLPRALRVAQYYVTSTDLTLRSARLRAGLPPMAPQRVRERLAVFRAKAREMAATVAPGEGYDRERGWELLAAAKEEYAALKHALLEAGAAGEVGTREMSNWLECFSMQRRCLVQLEKAGRYLRGLPEPAALEDNGG